MEAAALGEDVDSRQISAATAALNYYRWKLDEARRQLAAEDSFPDLQIIDDISPTADHQAAELAAAALRGDSRPGILPSPAPLQDGAKVHQHESTKGQQNSTTSDNGAICKQPNILRSGAGEDRPPDADPPTVGYRSRAHRLQSRFRNLEIGDQ